MQYIGIIGGPSIQGRTAGNWILSRNFIGALPGVLTVAAWVAAFIVSVGLAEFTVHKIEETDF